jgi:pilus assembly protein Flp/PilA
MGPRFREDDVAVVSAFPPKSHLGLNLLFSVLLNLLTTNPALLWRGIGAAEAAAPPRESAMRQLIAKFARDESGATAIEYCLIAVGISLAIIAVVQGLGTTLNTRFTSVNNSLK